MYNNYTKIILMKQNYTKKYFITMIKTSTIIIITITIIIIIVTVLRSGVVSQARGSAYIEMQNTKVTCAVYPYTIMYMNMYFYKLINPSPQRFKDQR